jgi:hypothetical protein
MPFGLPSALAILLASSLALAAPPRPPCAAPRGVVPAVPESMCSTVVSPINAAGVVVRSYGVPASEVLVTDLTPGSFPYGEVLNISVSNIILYLQRANSAGTDILASRTVPITVRPPGKEAAWLVSMMVSTAHFPDPSKIPTPNNFEMSLEPVSERLFAALAFNTSRLPTEADFKVACAELEKGVPKKYSVVSGGWSPTYAIYSPQAAKLFTNECWLQVQAA